MSETIAQHGAVEEPVVESAAQSVSDEQLIAMLVGRARSDGLQLTGEVGCCSERVAAGHVRCIPLQRLPPAPTS